MTNLMMRRPGNGMILHNLVFSQTGHTTSSYITDVHLKRTAPGYGGFTLGVSDIKA